jgi:hypothetical protein
MPLYAEFLATVLSEPNAESDDSSPGALLATLLERGRRASVARSPIDRLALELRYDAALVRLCWSVDIPADPDTFDPPARARDELESRLRAAGLPVAQWAFELAPSDGTP